jgi:hypothetical protein
VGLSDHITLGLAVVLTLLVLLTALAWPRRLLLLLLTRFLLAAALLLSALLLTTLLLLAMLLVWILIHCTSSPTLVRAPCRSLAPHGNGQCVVVAFVPVHGPAQL